MLCVMKISRSGGGHSARVRMRLLVNGASFRIAQIGPDFLFVESPGNHPSARATIELQVDDARRSWEVIASRHQGRRRTGRARCHRVAASKRFLYSSTRSHRAVSAARLNRLPTRLGRRVGIQRGRAHGSAEYGHRNYRACSQERASTGPHDTRFR